MRLPLSAMVALVFIFVCVESAFSASPPEDAGTAGSVRTPPDAPNAHTDPRVIQSHCFVVKDSAGRDRAVLGFQDEKEAASRRVNPTLRLLAPNGQVRFQIGYNDTEEAGILHILRADGAHGVTLRSDKGRNSMTFEHNGEKQPPIIFETWRDPGGRGDGGVIEFFNPRGIPQVGLAVWPDNGPGMRLYDPEGKPYEPGNPPAVRVPVRPRPNIPAPADGKKAVSDGSGSTDKEFPVVEAANYQLVDDQRQVRAAFGHVREAGEDAVFLLFCDVNGTIRVGMFFHASTEMVKVAFNDERGHESLGLSASPNGNGLFLFGSNQKTSIDVSVVNPCEGKVGTTGVGLNGSDGQYRVLFGEHRNRGTLGAWDSSRDEMLHIE